MTHPSIADRIIDNLCIVALVVAVVLFLSGLEGL